MSFTIGLAVGRTAGLILSITMRINMCLTAGQSMGITAWFNAVITGGPDLSPGIIHGSISLHSKHSIPTNHCTLKQSLIIEVYLSPLPNLSGNPTQCLS